MQARVSYNFSSGVGSPRFLIPPEDVKHLLEQISNHCGKISVAKVNLPRSSAPLMLTMWSTPNRKKLRNLRNCAEVLASALAIVPLFRNSSCTTISKGLFTVPHQSTFR